MLAIGDAHANLARGSAFLARQRCDAPGKTQRRVIANGLRELDRMLNLLIEAVAAGAAPRRLDAAAFGRETNAARKLDRLAGLLALPAIDRERLRAVGRVRACLFHCDGTAHARSIRADLGAAAARACDGASAGGKLALTAAELSAICDFYGAVAAGLFAAALPAPLTFRGSDGISLAANVACDGI